MLSELVQNYNYCQPGREDEIENRRQLQFRPTFSDPTEKALSLHNCRGVSDAALRALASHCPALVSLDIRWCVGLGGAPGGLAALLEALPSLQVTSNNSNLETTIPPASQ